MLYSGHPGEDKYLFPCPESKPKSLGLPARNLVATLEWTVRKISLLLYFQPITLEVLCRNQAENIRHQNVSLLSAVENITMLDCAIAVEKCFIFSWSHA